MSEAAARARALAGLGHLGKGGEGPWENRTHRIAQHTPSYPVVACWVNADLNVQLLQHPTHPGVDHLLVARNDGGTAIGWRELQALKDRLLPDGQLRWALEVFPPRAAIVDNANLRHVWVMPAGYTPPVDLRDVDT